MAGDLFFWGLIGFHWLIVFALVLRIRELHMEVLELQDMLDGAADAFLEVIGKAEGP